MKPLAAFGAGLLFSMGLIFSGMTQPINIIGFLDFFGDWNPSLAFVMVGAVGVYAALSRLVLKMKHPLFDLKFDLPHACKIDKRLLIGSAAFGIGWGLGGFCPGPAVTTLGMGITEAFIFMSAMLIGIFLHRIMTANGTSQEDGQTACG